MKFSPLHVTLEIEKLSQDWNWSQLERTVGESSPCPLVISQSASGEGPAFLPTAPLPHQSGLTLKKQQ